MIPLLKETHARADVLGREDARATLDAAIRSMPPPSCIALYGSWGSGKTTLLRFAYRRWGGDEDEDALENSRAIWFDPWEHEQRGDVISPLLHAIVTDIRRRRPYKDVKELAVRLGKTLLSLTAKLGLAYLGGRVSEIKDLKPDDLTRFFGEWEKFHNEIAEVKAQFKQLVDEALAGLGDNGRLVVFLDDLDRCLPDSVVTLLEATKLLLCGRTGDLEDAPVTFVFGLDRTIVGEAIAKRYPGASQYTGESYLEKIFDLSLEVPFIDEKQIAAFIEKHWDRTRIAGVLGPVGGKELVSTVLREPAFANPRVIKRCLNRLVLLLDAEERRAATAALLNAPRDRERFLLWVAGAERFRSFRYAFMEASSTEVQTFHMACRPESPTARLDQIVRAVPISDGLRRVLGTPGFLGYYERLILPGTPAEAVDAERKPHAAGKPLTLRDLDAHLRRYGL